MNAPQQTPQGVQARPEAKTRWVIAVATGYYGNQLRKPDGDEVERAPFEVPVGLKGSWFKDAPQHIAAKAEAKKQRKASGQGEDDLG